MKHTKLQKEVLEMSKKLPALTEAQAAYPYEKLFPKVGYYLKKGEVWCQCCGHIDHVLKPVLAISIEVESHTCPKCGADLKLHHWDRDKSKYSNEGIRYSIVQPFKGWMVIRTFDVQRNNTKGEPTSFFMPEVYQNWIDENGKEIVLGKRYTRSPYYFNWDYCSGMDVKRHNHTSTGYFELEDVFDVSRNNFYPRVSVTPLLRRNGWTNKILSLRVSVVDAICQLLKNPAAETMVKTGQMSVFEYMLRRGDYTIPYQHALNICNRNRYIVRDATLWFDYLDALVYFNADTHNAHYVCPPDLKKAHDLWMRKMNKAIAKRNMESKRKGMVADELEYKRTKGKFFDIRFSDGIISVSVLQSVEDFIKEGETMHHCVFSNEYYKKPDSLILSARIEEKPIETVEVNLRTLQIIQSRGVCNKNTEYHDRIIDLVEKNIDLIRQRK